jgi:hypothetical protein
MYGRKLPYFYSEYTMYQTISVKLANKLNCCVGDMVTMQVRAVQKLTSYGSAHESSGVPAIILAAGVEANGTFSYVLRYDACVLRNPCNYLIPNDVCSVCCTSRCDCVPPKPTCCCDPCCTCHCGCGCTNECFDRCGNSFCRCHEHCCGRHYVRAC